ncbi:MAG: hypothetical protein H7Z17_00930 [Fuerstia sp.]|nr:hypothetical protein [Fuerstiella sp.]
MPVVARCIQILNGMVAVNQCPLIVLTMWLAWYGLVQAQENTESAAPVVATDEVTPAAPVQDAPDSELPPEDPKVQPLAAGCAKEIVDQNALTAKVRAINNKLESIPAAQFLQLKRPVAAGIQNGAGGAADLENLKLALQYRLFQATDPEFVANADNVKNLLTEMDREIRIAGGQAGNAQNTKAYRQKYCDTVLAVAKQMFDNNLDARSIAIQVIKELYFNKTATGLIENHSESLTALLGLLKDPQQPDSVKVVATAAISYILSNMSVIPQQQAEISDVIALELDRQCTEIPYQMDLVQTLYGITVARKPVGPPTTTVMRTFVKLVDDRNRSLQVRCQAAYGIGNGAYDAKIDFDPLTWKVANLALEASVFFNQAPGDPAWPHCGADLFFAFRHRDKNGLTKQLPMLPHGMLNRAATSVPVKDSGNLVALKFGIPLWANKAKISQADQAELKAWIDANQALQNKPWE